MTTSRLVEMGKQIYGMHGLDDRNEQRFFFKGMIYFYDMGLSLVSDNGFIREIYYANFKDSENSVCTIEFEDNGDIRGVKRYEDIHYVPYLSNLRAPVKRCF